MSREEHPSAATEALRDSFEPYTKRELADMLAHVIKTYVIDGVKPSKPELGIIDFPKHLRDLGFTQLVAHLKMHLDLPELNLFSVSGADVLVKIGGRDYSITNPHTAPPPRPSASEEPSAPAAEGGRAAAKPEEEAPAEEEKKPDGPVELSDRFRMLELD